MKFYFRFVKSWLNSGKNDLNSNQNGYHIASVEKTNNDLLTPEIKSDTLDPSDLVEKELTEQQISKNIVILKSIKRYKYLQIFLKIVMVIGFLGYIILDDKSTTHYFIIFLLSMFVSFFSFLFLRTEVQFKLDESFKNYYENFNNFFTTLKKNRRIWESKTYSINYNRKYHAGAYYNIKRSIILIFKRKPPFMKINIKCLCLVLSDKEIYFLPNGVLINTKFSLSFIELKDLYVKFGTTIFIEGNSWFIARDAKVIGYTWQYVNRDGSPDQRFNHNNQLKKCLYGEIVFSAYNKNNFQVTILHSNAQLSEQLKMYFNTAYKMLTYKKYNEKTVTIQITTKKT